MQIPETPNNIEQLDLMKLLADYADAKSHWHSEFPIGDNARQACRTLHANLCELVTKVLAPILDRIGAREMDTFTMHDRKHGLKVAHLMWHILSPSRRERLTPPEIAMLVLSAHLHDLGMALSKEERTARLAADSDLWNRLEVQEVAKSRMEQLRLQVGDANLSASLRHRAELELDQAEEALLCQDTRERHATRERYEEILNMLRVFHREDPVKIPDIDGCLSFDGQSFSNKLVDVCVSHNEDSEALVRRDPSHPERPRFPKDFPVGCCTVDLHMVAATLRLADILDFDRERTPPTLFHYLIPGPLSPQDSLSVLEWGKHMAISNWQVDKDEIVFRGRCRNHIIHHAIVQFCAVIENEIAATRATFGAMHEPSSWPFQLPASVKTEIHEEGYRYVPYRFELDDQRIYELLMGGAIYDNPLVAVRELVQNAVDACKLRDALMQLNDPVQPKTTGRIIVRYEDPMPEHSEPTLTVTDTGTGMDAFILQRYFLKVGQSYYRSVEFNQDRVSLRKQDLDFAPVSEFGIGFLSCFLLADRLKVETALWEPRRGDTRKRTLLIDGPTRLIRLDENQNEGVARFKGTRITLYLTRGGKEKPKAGPPAWEEIQEYLEDVCEDLPYTLNLEHRSDEGVDHSSVKPKPLTVSLPSHLEPVSVRIKVERPDLGLEGEIVIPNMDTEQRAQEEAFKGQPVSVGAAGGREVPGSVLLRGGFKVGILPGIPKIYIRRGKLEIARLRLTWALNENRRYGSPNLARNAISNNAELFKRVENIWLSHLVENAAKVPTGVVGDLHFDREVLGPFPEGREWLQKYDALSIYRLAAQGWQFTLLRDRKLARKKFSAWEEGIGAPLPYDLDYYPDLSIDLLELVLPRVATLQVTPKGYYVKPPRADWKTILSGWREYMTNPLTWGAFVEYTDELQTFIYFYLGATEKEFINSSCETMLPGLTEDEASFLSDSLVSLHWGTRQENAVSLTPSQARMVRRAQEVCGNLKIGDLKKSWRLDSFKIPEPEE